MVYEVVDCRSFVCRPTNLLLHPKSKLRRSGISYHLPADSPHSVALCISSISNTSHSSVYNMDSHARSLLDRLNYGSPKPPKTPTAPETKVAEAVSLSTPENKESQFQSGSQSPSPPPEKRGLPATLQTEASIKLNDMLMTARQRSRETSSASPSNSASLNEGASEANSSDTVIPPLAPSTRAVNPLTEKDEQQNVVNTSDGDSSAVAEEMLTTPAGSNISSIVSNGTYNSMEASIPASDDTPQGVRIVNDVPSIVSLAASKSEIPRLQITTDASGRATFVGEGIEHIANLSRSFGAYDRHIIGATSKYIVYALKGTLL